MRRWLAFILVFLMFNLATAQTEVEGEVSGVWTREGNPYLVIDSTWVPEGERLTLQAGVEVRFNEGQGLDIFGTLEALGVGVDLLEDSVRIRFAEDVENWKGLRFHGSNRTEWNYAQIECPDTAFILDQGYEMNINHCYIEAEEMAIAGYDYGVRPRGWTLNFSHSHIEGGMFLLTLGGTVTASNSEFEFTSGDRTDQPGFIGIGTGFRLNDCIVHGGLHLIDGTGYSFVENCRFIKGLPDMRVSVGVVGGGMRRTFVEGGVGVHLNHIGPNFEYNTIVGRLSVGDDALISNCDIRDGIHASSADNITFRNCIMSRGFGSSHVRTLTIDSCFFVYDKPTGSTFGCSNGIETTVTRSVFRSDYLRVSGQEILFDHNTFVFDTVWFGAIDGTVNICWTNNIFLNSVPGGALFFQGSMPSFEYNCVWGFEFAAWIPPYTIPIEEIDSSNIIADPILEWYGFGPLLSPYSPCIDRGDPDAPRDADGTRSDIGARAFYQRNAVSMPHDGGQYPELLSVEAFPNPFNNNLNVSFSSPSISPVSITLLDVTGRNVLETRRTTSLSGSGIIAMNATSLPSGNYYLLIRTDQYTRAISVYCVK